MNKAEKISAFVNLLSSEDDSEYNTSNVFLSVLGKVERGTNCNFKRLVRLCYIQ